jgi:hypothetical protein
MRSTVRPASLAFLGVLVLAARAGAHEVTTYETDVRPILLRSCGGGGCHIGEETSGVNLSTYASIMASAGEQYGAPVVVAGDPDASPLIDKVSSDTPRFGVRMPNGGEPLSELEIGVLRAWIRDGALEGHLPLRGDSDGNDARELTDAVYLLNYLFFGGPAPPCLPQADADGNERLQITDAILVLDFLFRGGVEPAPLSEEEAESCEEGEELSFGNIYDVVFAQSCAFSSCHSAEIHRNELSLATVNVAYEELVGVVPFNSVAQAAGMLLVDPGRPENSFLLRKLTQPRPGEGNRMPANSPVPLSDATIAGIREWILAGAPREGTIPGVPAITDEPPPPIDRIAPPPAPENGMQLHLEPFQIGPRAEREIFFYVDRPFRDHPTTNVDVERIDIHMTEHSHHFILYEWIGTSPPPAGIRPLQSVVDVLTTHRLIVGAQQSFFTIAFPPGVGFRFTRNTSFDLNSHYINLSGAEPLLGEVYINLFFAEPGTLTRPVRPIFDINTNISVSPGQTRTTTLDFPSISQAVTDPEIGSGGSLSREIHLHVLSSHMHRHGVRFTATVLQNRRPLDPPGMIYDNYSWDDPLFSVFDPPLVLRAGQGLRYATTHTYHDPPSPTSPPLTFGVTSEDEMAILLGYYTLP